MAGPVSGRFYCPRAATRADCEGNKGPKMIRLICCVSMGVTLVGSPAFAADLDVSPVRRSAPREIPLSTPREIPIQQNQSNCMRWTDECVSCTRGDPGPTCSNVGFACQPKAIRCLSN